MPEMNGLDALRLIQARHPKVRVIMCSSLTERGAKMTIDALMAGAGDYVTKQHSSELSEGAYETLRLELLTKIRTMFGRPTHQNSSPQPQSGLTISSSGLPGVVSALTRGVGSLTAAPTVLSQKRLKAQILAIGVSTGGPAALAEILPLIPAGFSLPIAIVQHMPPFFTRLLAERLSRLSEIPVFEATQGMELKAGMALIAPGDFHMRLVKKNGTVEVDLNQQEQENSCRPAVDVLFRSVAEVYGGAVIAVILTGMGQDGLLGVRALKGLGAAVLVQDSATSVVWGMPGAVAGAKLADAVLPLKDIIPEVLRLI
jgi:two-component system chemotaxis response regulator CheB